MPGLNVKVIESRPAVTLRPAGVSVTVKDDRPAVTLKLGGIQGAPGQGNVLVLKAAHPISALRAVTGAGVGEIRYALPGDPVIGIALTAGSLGGDISVVSSGVIDISGLPLVSGAPVFLSAAEGILTSTPPPSGPLQRIGVKDATSPSLSFIQSPPFNRL